MPISSKCLFHFTKTREVLTLILQNGFWPRYCGEYKWGNREYDFALPMVCFCDIPLSLIENHCKFYGWYGIGLNETWRDHQHYLNPVFYLSDKSSSYKSINYIINDLVHDCLDDMERRILYRIKKVKGYAYDCSNHFKQKKFYDEREWRYIPETIENVLHTLTKQTRTSDIQTKKELEKLSERTKNSPLVFTHQDIEYLIIPHENERVNFINDLKLIYSTLDEEDFYQLISKVLVFNQIKKDF